MSDNTLSARARKKYKAQIEKAAREKHVANFNKRMDYARIGIAAQKAKNFRAALQNYLSYIEALKKAKGADLTPSCFDPKQDVAEILMLTGVFWDLAKIYDKVSAKDKTKVKYFLDKFILFSKGTSYESLSKEMMRKFLTNGNPNHRSVFKEAYVKLGGGKCFVATAVEEHCEVGTVYTLKRFRDEVLSKNIFGRSLIRIYYQISPFIAIRLIRSSEGQQKRVARLLGKVASAVSFRFFPDGK